MDNLPGAQHLVSSAAPRSTLTTPRQWREQAQGLFLWLGVLATFPRLLWVMAFSAVASDNFDIFRAIVEPLRGFAILADVGVIIVVARLGFLDVEAEGAPASRLRRAAFAVLIGALVWSVLRDVIISNTDLSALWNLGIARVLFFALVPALADLIFALWLGRLLLTQGAAPMLGWVVGGAVVAQTVCSFLPFGSFVSTAISVGVVFATMIEIVRVRRVLS